MANETSKSFFRTVAVGVIGGVASALASVVVFRLLEIDAHPAVIGGVAGAVAGTCVVMVMKRTAGK